LNSKAQLIGLISDTHGLLRPEAVEALRGADLILHAGDVGKPEILEELRKISPVVAIRGNVDTAPWTASLRETELVETHGANIYMLHNVNDLNLNPVAAEIHIILFGHSHQPTQYEKNGVLYLNPGSAGPRRFNLPITVARLDLGATPWKFEIIPVKAPG
jgi:uncharacterized protein